MNLLYKTWNRLSGLPFGRRIFNLGIRFYIPYTGSMRAGVEELRPGFARVTLRDRRSVRNHLRSIHAIALANLIEYTGNLALACGLPADARFIVKSIKVEYLKKARGRLVGECTAPVVTDNEKREIELHVSVRDVGGDEVAHGVLLSLTGPVK